MAKYQSTQPESRSRQPRGKRRRGAALVEFAFVAPAVFLTAFAAFEFGRVLMVMHGMEDAAREGCRKAIIKGATIDDVDSAMSPILETFGLSSYTVTLDPDPPSEACQFEPVSVSVSVRLGDVLWLPTPQFIGDNPLTVSYTMPQESDECTAAP